MSETKEDSPTTNGEETDQVLFSLKCGQPASQSLENLLTAAYDKQLQLVDEAFEGNQSNKRDELNKSRAANKTNSNNNNNSKKVKNHTQQNKKSDRDDNDHKEATSEIQYSNKSRIYRFVDNDNNKPEEPTIPTMPPMGLVMDVQHPKDECEARTSMLISWYRAGYQTGYYEAMKKYCKEGQ